MGLNINLFVHGVPMGQKIWGPKGDDQRYISSFYGPKWDAPEVMKIDVMTFGGNTYCYYSFVKGQNVCDTQGRAGSYFALTLRINAFYSDVQNLYNILKAAYDKLCVGVCLQETNGVSKYILADFQNVDKQLRDIESHLLNYISEFSVSEDIISLSGFQLSGQASLQNLNLHECTRKIALDCVNKSGKLMVSPWYLASSAAKTVAQYKAEMQNTIQKAQQELQAQQKATNEKIEAANREADERIATISRQSREDLRICEEESRKQIALANERNEREMSALKESYADVDAKISDYKHSIKKLDQEKQELQNQCRRCEKELQTKNSTIRKQEQRIQSLEGSHIGSGGYRPMPEPQKINWLVVGGISFFTVVLITCIIYFVMSTISKTETITNQENQIELLTTQNDSLQNVLQTKYSVQNIENNTEDSLIKIEGLENGQNYIIAGELYKVTVSSELKGELKSDDFKIQNMVIMAKRENVGKECVIEYVADDKVIATKRIYVKEK